MMKYTPVFAFIVSLIITLSEAKANMSTISGIILTPLKLKCAEICPEQLPYERKDGVGISNLPFYWYVEQPRTQLQHLSYVTQKRTKSVLDYAKIQVKLDARISQDSNGCGRYVTDIWPHITMQDSHKRFVSLTAYRLTQPRNIDPNMEVEVQIDFHVHQKNVWPFADKHRDEQMIFHIRGSDVGESNCLIHATTPPPTTRSPTENPTVAPTTRSPTRSPTVAPTTGSPTRSPTVTVTLLPTSSLPTRTKCPLSRKTKRGICMSNASCQYVKKRLGGGECVTRQKSPSPLRCDFLDKNSCLENIGSCEWSSGYKCYPGYPEVKPDCNGGECKCLTRPDFDFSFNKC
jgi:hypothetical protein